MGTTAATRPSLQSVAVESLVSTWLIYSKEWRTRCWSPVFCSTEDSPLPSTQRHSVCCPLLSLQLALSTSEHTALMGMHKCAS